MKPSRVWPEGLGIWKVLDKSLGIFLLRGCFDHLIGRYDTRFIHRKLVSLFRFGTHIRATDSSRWTDIRSKPSRDFLPHFCLWCWSIEVEIWIHPFATPTVTVDSQRLSQGASQRSWNRSLQLDYCETRMYLIWMSFALLS